MLYTFLHTFYTYISTSEQLNQPGTGLSLRLMLKDFVRDIVIDCRGDETRSDVRPDGWDVEVVGPGLRVVTVPVLSWSFSALRFSTVICK